MMARYSLFNISLIHGIAKARATWVQLYAQMKSPSLRFLIEPSEPAQNKADHELRDAGASASCIDVISTAVSAIQCLNTDMRVAASLEFPAPADAFRLMHMYGTIGRGKNAIVGNFISGGATDRHSPGPANCLGPYKRPYRLEALGVA